MDRKEKVVAALLALLSAVVQVPLFLVLSILALFASDWIWREFDAVVLPVILCIVALLAFARSMQMVWISHSRVSTFVEALLH